MGTVAAGAILMATAGRGAAGKHDFDEISLDGVFAEGLKLMEQFYDKPRSHMPSRVPETKSSVKRYFTFFPAILIFLPMSYGVAVSRSTPAGPRARWGLRYQRVRRRAPRRSSPSSISPSSPASTST